MVREERVQAAGKGWGCGERAGLQKSGLVARKDRAVGRGLHDEVGRRVVGLQVKAARRGEFPLVEARVRVAGQLRLSRGQMDNRVGPEGC